MNIIPMQIVSIHGIVMTVAGMEKMPFFGPTKNKNSFSQKQNDSCGCPKANECSFGRENFFVFIFSALSSTIFPFCVVFIIAVVVPYILFCLAGQREIQACALVYIKERKSGTHSILCILLYVVSLDQ